MSRRIDQRESSRAFKLEFAFFCADGFAKRGRTTSAATRGVAAVSFTGKTSTVFPAAALWTLYDFPRARVMYLSATVSQVWEAILCRPDPLPASPGVRKLDLAERRGADARRRLPVRTRDRHGRHTMSMSLRMEHWIDGVMPPQSPQTGIP
jgi:hypothetical protein